MELVQKYTDFTELTTLMINEFIDKIIVNERGVLSARQPKRFGIARAVEQEQNQLSFPKGALTHRLVVASYISLAPTLLRRCSLIPLLLLFPKTQAFREPLWRRWYLEQ